jgi:hypothetical protein
MRELNPQAWFGERELTHVPPHFVKCQTPVTTESLIWVSSALTGRYAISTYNDDSDFFLSAASHLYLEDPREATIYELRWAGSQNNSLF